MVGKYAINTETSVDKSKTDISRLLSRYGATTTSINETQQFALVAAEIHGVQIRIRLDLPQKNDPNITMTPQKRYRSKPAREKEYQRAIKSTWRALFMILNSRLKRLIVVFQRRNRHSCPGSCFLIIQLWKIMF